MSDQTYVNGYAVLFDNILYKLDPAFLADLFDRGVDPFETHPERDELAMRFARSNHHGLQEAAARSEGLPADDVKALADSRNYKVRLALADNLDALAKLSVDDLVWLGQADIKIADNMLYTLKDGDPKLHHRVTERLLADYEAGDVGHERDSRIAHCVRVHARRIMADTLNLEPTHSHPGFRGKLCTMRMKYPPVKNRALLYSGYDYFTLDPEEVTQIIDRLWEDKEKRRAIVKRHLDWLLRYPDLEVVEHVAEHCKMPAEALEKFLKIGCHDVGMAAMQNDNAHLLSDFAIKNFIYNDASALADLVCHYKPELTDRLIALYEEDKCLGYVIAEYRKEEERREHFFEDDDDDLEDAEVDETDEDNETENQESTYLDKCFEQDDEEDDFDEEEPEEESGA
ncbi:MAG: hypothetical protein Q4E62_03040, partial [Sutterellaceae bacterium]|nr:hypothetical protein [Sutterellaceae bacterium]